MLKLRSLLSKGEFRVTIPSGKKGFTLIELIVTLAIMSIVIGSIFSVLIYGQKTFNNGSNEYAAQDSVRQAIDFLSNKIRYASNLLIMSVEQAKLEKSNNYTYNYFFKENGKIYFYKFVDSDNNGVADAYSETIISDGLNDSDVFSKQGDKTLRINISKTLGLNTFQTGKDILLENFSLMTPATAIQGLGSGKAVRFGTDVVSGTTVPVTSVTISGSANIDCTKSDTLQLSAAVMPENATNKTLNWTVDQPSVATVDYTGKVTAKSNGTVVVKAESTDGSNKFATVSITISGITSAYKVTFTVTDGVNPISGANVGFYNNVIATDNSGNAEFIDIKSGEGGVYTITHIKFKQNTGAITVTSHDVNHSVTLIPATYQVKITVKNSDDAIPVTGATVSLNGQNTTTDASGVAVFENIGIGDCQYNITKTGFYTNTGNISITNGNINQTVSLIPKKYKVTFTVKNSKNSAPVSGANINFKGLNKSTDGSGIAEFDNIGIENNISYTISKVYYKNETGTLDVIDNDVIRNMAITPTLPALPTLSNILDNSFTVKSDGREIDSISDIKYNNQVVSGKVVANINTGSISINFSITGSVGNNDYISFKVAYKDGQECNYKVSYKNNGEWNSINQIN